MVKIGPWPAGSVDRRRLSSALVPWSGFAQGRAPGIALARQFVARGTTIVKDFPPNGLFRGTLLSVAREKGGTGELLYRFRYEDGDEEDLHYGQWVELRVDRVSSSSAATAATSTAEATSYAHSIATNSPRPASQLGQAAEERLCNGKQRAGRTSAAHDEPDPARSDAESGIDSASASDNVSDNASDSDNDNDRSSQGVSAHKQRASTSTNRRACVARRKRRTAHGGVEKKSRTAIRAKAPARPIPRIQRTYTAEIDNFVSDYVPSSRAVKAWERNFATLKEWITLRGTSTVPASLGKVPGLSKSSVSKFRSLRTWLGNQRRAFFDEKRRHEGLGGMAQNRISTEQARRLDDVGMIWDQEKERWETGFKALEDFIVKFGYANVRQSMKGYTSLGTWLTTQRTKFRRGALLEERRDRLVGLGVDLDPLNIQIRSQKARDDRMGLPQANPTKKVNDNDKKSGSEQRLPRKRKHT